MKKLVATIVCSFVFIGACDNDKYKKGLPVNLSKFSIPYKMESFHGLALFEYCDAHGFKQSDFTIYPEGIRRKDSLVQYPTFGPYTGWLTIDTVKERFVGVLGFE